MLARGAGPGQRSANWASTWFTSLSPVSSVSQWWVGRREIEPQLPFHAPPRITPHLQHHSPPRPITACSVCPALRTPCSPVHAPWSCHSDSVVLLLFLASVEHTTSPNHPSPVSTHTPTALTPFLARSLAPGMFPPSVRVLARPPARPPARSHRRFRPSPTDIRRPSR